MNQIYEDPLLFIVMAAVTAVVLGFAWLQTGRKQFIYAMGATIALIVAMIVIERMVVTDREAVDKVLRDAARAVERNDLPGLLKCVHSQSPAIRAQAQAEFPKYKFREVDIKQNLEITFDREEQPTEATANFNVVVVGDLADGTVELQRVPRFVTVVFRKDGDQWRAFSYDHQSADVGLFKKKKLGDR